MKNKDIPIEKVIHYIVKDYRRMYEMHDALVERLREAETKVAELSEKKNDADGAVKRVRLEYEKKIKDLRESRDAVVKAATEDLQDRLDIVDRQNKLLVQALSDPEKVSQALCAYSTTISTDDERLDLAVKQLEKALVKFNSIEIRLSNVEMAIENGMDGEALKAAKKRFSNAFAKISSATQRIENFFDILGKVNIVGAAVRPQADA